MSVSRALGEPWERAATGADGATRAWSRRSGPARLHASDQFGRRWTRRAGLLNCNADTAAGALAGALDADVLVLLSDVDQLRSDADDATTADRERDRS